MSVGSIEGMTIESCIEAFRVLFGVFSQVSCSARFRIGDIYNLLGDNDPLVRRAAMKEIKDKFSELDCQNLRTCGWVAGKWPADQRNDHGWNYYLRNHPDKPAKVPEKILPVFTAIDSKSYKDAFVVKGQDFSGKCISMIVRYSLLAGSEQMDQEPEQVAA